MQVHKNKLEKINVEQEGSFVWSILYNGIIELLRKRQRIEISKKKKKHVND